MLLTMDNPKLRREKINSSSENISLSEQNGIYGEILILKTNISTRDYFRTVKNELERCYKIDECTIDLDDIDKVVRVVGNNIEINEVVNKIKSYGFVCEELRD